MQRINLFIATITLVAIPMTPIYGAAPAGLDSMKLKELIEKHPCPNIQQCNVPTPATIVSAIEELERGTTIRTAFAEEKVSWGRDLITAVENLSSSSSDHGTAYAGFVESIAADIEKTLFAKPQLKLSTLIDRALAKEEIGYLRTLHTTIEDWNSLISVTPDSNLQQAYRLKMAQDFMVARSKLVEFNLFLFRLANNQFYNGESLEHALSHWSSYDLGKLLPGGCSPNLQVTVYPKDSGDSSLNIFTDTAILRTILNGTRENPRTLNVTCVVTSKSKVVLGYDQKTHSLANPYYIKRELILPGNGGDLAFHIYKSRYSASSLQNLAEFLRNNIRP